MLLAKWIGCLLLLTVAGATITAQTLRPENDPRNTSPTTGDTPKMPTTTFVYPGDWQCDAPPFDLSSPTRAYETLYTAVKCKSTATIRKILSAATTEFIIGTSAMQKITFDTAIQNGLTESTMGSSLPEICNERIEGEWAALEVKPANGKWEDLPFHWEDGAWKLAVGDIFNGTYEVKSKPKCIPPPGMPVTSPGPMPRPRTKHRGRRH